MAGDAAVAAGGHGDGGGDQLLVLGAEGAVLHGRLMQAEEGVEGIRAGLTVGAAQLPLILVDLAIGLAHGVSLVSVGGVADAWEPGSWIWYRCSWQGV